MYMEKLIVGYKAKGVIDLNKPLMENIHAVAQALEKPVNRLSVITLAKPRHDEAIRQMQQMGVRVFAIPDGDVAASVLTCLPDNEIDMLYCIGGAPEGVVSAAVVRALDGDMQGRLLPRHKVKGNSDDNRILGADELARCAKMGVQAEVVLTLEDMVHTDNVIISVTGITKGDLLEGITSDGTLATTETLLIRGKSRTIRRISSTHYLDRKDQRLRDIIL